MSPREAYEYLWNMTPQDFFYKSKKELKKLEKAISKDEFYSYRYAVDILNGPFHLGHPVIFNSTYKNDYIKFLKLINYNLIQICDQYGEWLI
jgi:hypothetical protein